MATWAQAPDVFPEAPDLTSLLVSVMCITENAEESVLCVQTLITMLVTAGVYSLAPPHCGQAECGHFAGHTATESTEEVSANSLSLQFFKLYYRLVQMNERPPLLYSLVKLRIFIVEFEKY